MSGEEMPLGIHGVCEGTKCHKELQLRYTANGCGWYVCKK